MSKQLKPDLCVIGGGAAGLSVAAGSAQMGANVVLVERGKMGGDCLNYGCVPSKSLLAAAHRASLIFDSEAFGINCHEFFIDHAAVRRHIRDVIAEIEPHDSVERFEGLGVKVIQASAKFEGPDVVVANDHRIYARHFVIATGSYPAIPPIPGLDQVPYLTNETVFDVEEYPQDLIVLGGGPIGAELAQAHQRLGSRVSLLEVAQILGKDDPEAVDIIRKRLWADDVDIREGIELTQVSGQGNKIAVDFNEGGYPQRIVGSHLLVAAGRKPNMHGLNLEAANIAYSERGIKVDRRLRTSNKRFFAIGDVASSYQFTHVAGYHAGIVIRNALFRLPAKVDYRAVPRVTYTDPELAQVGLTEGEARARHNDTLRVLRWPFAENDRARAERETEGFIKVITTKRGKVLGATVVGRHAGELILPWVIAINEGLKIGALANVIAPYPTLGEVTKRAAGQFFIPGLFSPRTRWVVKLLQHLP